MNYNRRVLLFLRNYAVIIVGSILVLGGIGFLIAGQEGFLNGATWAIMLSLMALPVMVYVFIFVDYGSDYATRAGGWWYRKQTGEEDLKR